MPEHKIEIIEDWLLGVVPKCLYAKEEAENQSVFSEAKNDKLSHTKVSPALLPIAEVSKCNLMEDTQVSYVSDSYKSTEEYEDNDDSLADPDYDPISPTKLFPQFGNLSVSLHSVSDISTNNFKIVADPQISLTLEEKSSQNLKNSTDVYPRESPMVVVPVEKEISLGIEDKLMVETVSRKNYSDRKDYCIFCEKDVSHFARHVIKWHEQEFDVQRVLSCKTNSKDRRRALGVLRKRGNFVKNRVETKLRPVKRLPSNEKCTSSDNFLPCKYCLGFYKKKSLFRHTKICPSNYDQDITKKRQTSQSDGQTTLFLHSMYKHDELLKSVIFPRMRADDIGLIAKKDPLICKYAYSYAKGRRSKGNFDLVRQNMRRLAKLLKYAQKENCEIRQLVDILRPCHFQLIVAGVSKMAQYNPETEIYESPTLAINFGTLLKKCCDLAYIDLLQIKDKNEQRKDIKLLKRLIESQWADEISAQAGTNLNQNKWNKEDLLPLTSDLKKLNLFLQKVSGEAFNNLKTKRNDVFAYTTLKEVLYTQIILLNRRRPAEVAQLKVQTFKSVNLQNEHNNEFENCLTETEKILLNTYSRFIIRGKRGRGVPILLSPEMKKQFDYLIEIRNNFVSDNDFVFHTNGKGFIDGTKTLHKLVKKCKVERPASITATRLRKHLATITQLLQFSNNDMEQLSKFMGHTLKTHCSVYRMSDKIYQTAKVSKLLLLMMEGGAEKYRGKTLDEINIDLNPIYDNDNLMEEKEFYPTKQDDINPDFEKGLNVNNNQTQKSVYTQNSQQATLETRQTWSIVQKKIIAEYFSQNIKEKKSPRQHNVNEFVNLYPDLFKDRKWTSIKAVVYNIYTGKLKY